MGEGKASSQHEMRPEPDRAGATGFADCVLMAALQAPEAPFSPAAARTIAGLIGLLTAEGSTDEVAAILAPVPGGAVTFDVLAAGEGPQAADPGGRAASPPPPPAAPPPQPLTGLGVGRALREASRLAQNRDDLISVVAIGPDGLRRLVLERKPGAPFHFLFPSEGTFEGEPGARADAVARWQRLINADAAPSRPNAFLAPIVALPSGGDHGSDAGPGATAGSAPTLAGSTALVVPGPLPEVLAETVRDALADVTVEVDLGAIEQVVSDALRSALATSRGATPPPQVAAIRRAGG